MYKVMMIEPNGSTYEVDEVFETEEEARAFGQEECSSARVGREVLHLSNSGDYPLNEDDDDLDFEVIEVDS